MNQKSYSGVGGEQVRWAFLGGLFRFGVGRPTKHPSRAPSPKSSQLSIEIIKTIEIPILPKLARCRQKKFGFCLFGLLFTTIGIRPEFAGAGGGGGVPPSCLPRSWLLISVQRAPCQAQGDSGSASAAV